MEYQRTLGPIQGISMTVTTFVGTGLMVLPALSVSQANGFAFYAWLITAIMILPIAVIFAILGSHFPSVGGASHYIGQAFGKKSELAVGWLFLSIALVGPAVALKISAAYLGVALSLSQDAIFPLTLLTILASLFYTLAGVKNTSRFQSIVVIVLISVIILLAYKGNILSSVHYIKTPRSLPEWHVTSFAIGTIFWCFIGIEVMAHMGADFKQPMRDFPIALLVGVAIVVVLYLTLVLLITQYHTYGDELTNSQSLALLVGSILGDHSKKIFAIGAFIIAFTHTGMYLLGFARMVQSMSSQGSLPKSLSTISKNGTPNRAIYLITSVTTASVLFSHFSNSSLHWLIEMTNGAFLLIYTLTCIASLKLFIKPQKWVGALAVTCCILIGFFIGASMLFAFAIFVAAMYFEYYKNRKNLIPDSKIHVQ